MEGNIFSLPWQESNAVLVAEGEEFHVHRCILSLQSSVFKAMFGGNFEDATQDRIKLKDDSKHAMLIFLKLLYPEYMLEGDDVKNRKINNGNVLGVMKLADKYGAVNVIKACMKAEALNAETTLHFLPYAIRNELPIAGIIDTIIHRVTTKELANFAPQIDNNSIYVQTLVRKCAFFEEVVKDSHVTILHLLREGVEAFMAWGGDTSKLRLKCHEHGSSWMWNFSGIKNCKCCGVMVKQLVETCIWRASDSECTENMWKLLTITGDVETSLYRNINSSD